MLDHGHWIDGKTRRSHGRHRHSSLTWQMLKLQIFNPQLNLGKSWIACWFCHVCNSFAKAKVRAICKKHTGFLPEGQIRAVCEVIFSEKKSFFCTALGSCICVCASYRLDFLPKNHLVGRVLRSSWKAKKAEIETERQDTVDWLWDRVFNPRFWETKNMSLTMRQRWFWKWLTGKAQEQETRRQEPIPPCKSLCEVCGCLTASAFFIEMIRTETKLKRSETREKEKARGRRSDLIIFICVTLSS